VPQIAIFEGNRDKATLNQELRDKLKLDKLFGCGAHRS